MPSPPRFIYFDMGNVLLWFDHQRAARQMADVTGVSKERIWEIVFDTGMNLEYERGDLTSRQFFDKFCEQAGVTADYDAVAFAASDMFSLNVPMAAVATSLKCARKRIGILSNTCEWHWDFIAPKRFRVIRDLFEVHALSYRMKLLKPEPEIYTAAAELAGVEPGEIFFTDDRPENIEAAREAGFDAEPFSTAAATVKQLRERGVQFNY